MRREAAAAEELEAGVSNKCNVRVLCKEMLLMRLRERVVGMLPLVIVVTIAVVVVAAAIAAAAAVVDDAD